MLALHTRFILSLSLSLSLSVSLSLSLSHTHTQRKLGALCKWKASNGQRATYDAFIEALLAVGRVDIAENICKFLVHGECSVCVCQVKSHDPFQYHQCLSHQVSDRALLLSRDKNI